MLNVIKEIPWAFSDLMISIAWLVSARPATKKPIANVFLQMFNNKFFIQHIFILHIIFIIMVK